MDRAIVPNRGRKISNIGVLSITRKATIARIRKIGPDRAFFLPSAMARSMSEVSLTGCPQFGQLGALSDISLVHSGQATSIMVSLVLFYPNY